MLNFLQIEISNENKLRLKQLFFICVYWVVMIRLLIIQNFFGSFGFGEGSMTPKFFSILRDSLLSATGAGIAIGLITGMVEMFIFPKRFYHKPFLVLNIYRLLVYFISFIIVSFLSIWVYKQLTTNLTGIEILRSTWVILTSYGFTTLLFSGLILSVGISLLLTIQNKIGHKNFFPMLSGRYHKPREEDRIFLFIDLESSSYAAEKLGHVRYSQLIQACFRDLSDIAINYNSEIYQFVGDEAVITWKTKNKNNYLDSVLLFNKFKSVLEQKSHQYYYEFGIMPRFKGAVHSGKVMAAEVGGFLKSEIAYHGDVLNSASRMMEFCKPLQTDLIISDEIQKNISHQNNNFEISDYGEIKLRGKYKKLSVFGISEKSM